MHVVSWETNKTRFSKNTSPQIGENQNCLTWVRSPLDAKRLERLESSSGDADGD